MIPLQMISKMVSMPNISIGQARCGGAVGPGAGPGGAGETEPLPGAPGSVPCAGLPLAPPPPHHLVHPAAAAVPPGAFYPSLPVIDSELPPPNSPAYITAQVTTISLIN